MNFFFSTQQKHPLFSVTLAIIASVACLAGALYNSHQIATTFNYPKYAKKAPKFQADYAHPEMELYPIVALTGKIGTTHPLGDNITLIPGKYLQVTRIKEVFAWVEKSRRSKRVRRFSYKKQWISGRIKSSKNFRRPEGHENPENVHGYKKTYTTPQFTVGDYTVHSDNLELPEPKTLHIAPKNVRIPAHCILANNAIYTLKTPLSNISKPAVGDERIRYEAVVADGEIGTVWGKLHNNVITSAQLPPTNRAQKPAAFKRLIMSSAQEAENEIYWDYWKSQFIAGIITFLCMFMLWFIFASFLDKQCSNLLTNGQKLNTFATIVAAASAALATGTLSTVLFWMGIKPLYASIATALIPLSAIIFLLVMYPQKTFSNQKNSQRNKR